jgi:hypothetical protein
MSITYSQLITKIRNYTEVDSNVLTDAIVDDFIKDAEVKIYRAVDGDYNRKYATATFQANNRYLLLPTDLQVIRSVQHIASNNTRTFLEKRDNSFISEFNPTDATGTPKYYAMWQNTDGNQYIVVAPVPDAADSVQINYVKYPEHLFSSDNAAVVPNQKTSTYLSTKAPDLLFLGAMVEALTFLKSPDTLYNTYQNKYNQEIQAFGIEQMGRRRRGEYDDGVPRVKVPSPSP